MEFGSYLPVWAVVISLFLPVLGAAIAAGDRMLKARMQRRQGPPWNQPLLDVFKLASADSPPTNLGVVVLVWGMVSAGVAMGIAWVLGEVVLAVLLLGTLAILRVLVGMTSGSPHARGAARRLLLLSFAIELPILLWVVLYSRVDVAALADWQNALWLGTGLLFMLIAWQAVCDRSPWDVVEAHQLFVAGETVDLGGKSKAWALEAHWSEMGFFALWIIKLIWDLTAIFTDVWWYPPTVAVLGFAFLWIGAVIWDQGMPRVPIGRLVKLHVGAVTILLVALGLTGVL